ncbi:hypothetical protein SNEBB_008125 [Seison nebaliae]|nr:hypothetical protein SNEBB_008125 [Seison nebaliae]
MPESPVSSSTKTRDGTGIAVDSPIDLVRLCLDQRVHLKMHKDREIKGRLHAYDHHMNMILSEVEETIMEECLDEETNEIEYKTKRRQFPMIFLRGDGLIMLSPMTTTIY